jgi:hypothetical protein
MGIFILHSTLNNQLKITPKTYLLFLKLKHQLVKETQQLQDYQILNLLKGIRV